MASESRLVFTGEGSVDKETFAPREPERAEVGVRSIVSIISTGTETTALHRRFESGSHWETWGRYPFYPGYSIVGRVERLSPSCKSLREGQLVGLRAGHASYHVVPASDCHIIPETVPPEAAAWFAFAKIAFLGAKAANFRMGDAILVIGAGPIGQMAARWAHGAGARKVMVTDRLERRLTLAQRGGASDVFATPLSELAERARKVNNGQLPDVVVDTTGNHEVLPFALRAARKFGTVLILGDTGTPTEQRLTRDVITRGLHIVAAHDTHDTEEWDSQRIVQLFFALVTTGRFNLADLNTHEFSPDDYREAYAIADKHRDEAMGVLFRWT